MISGLQKMTLLDFPGKVACTVFLQTCNFRCPFCHNSDLLGMDGPVGMTDEELLSFLKKRQGLLEGVCITGGEPTLRKDLADLLRAIKALGYPIKLDTNGSRPEILKALAAEGLVDYVAMDIKNSPARYGETVGLSKMKLDPIEESMRFLLEGSLDYEFRTTVVAEFHDETAMESMALWVKSLGSGKKAKRFFLQSFIDRDSVLKPGLHAAEPEKMQEFARILAPCAELVQVRGTE